MTTTGHGAQRFIACIGFVNTPTNESYPRTLMYPSTDDHPVRPFGLIPVRDMTAPNGPVGTIYDAFVMGTMILGVGFLAANTSADRARIEAIRRGELFPELDVDRCRINDTQSGLEFFDWRIRAVTLGSAPTWTLPIMHLPES